MNMKLKGLGNRTYNVLFHTHTVSGIVISFALFVIFYAGAFALFRHEIKQWENPAFRQQVNPSFDYHKAIHKTDSLYRVDWAKPVYVYFPEEQVPFFRLVGNTEEGKQGDTTVASRRFYAYVAPMNYQVDELYEKTTLSDTLYFLHFFQQLPIQRGQYIAGLVAVFFLFATITGLLIHWRSLFTKFYAFITEGSWKTIWTNLHTVLGVIGLPFQIMYAVTGAFFGILILILAPVVFMLYGGDTDQVYQKISPDLAIKVNPEAPTTDKNIPFTTLYKQVVKAYPTLHVKRASLTNYGKEDAFVTWYLGDEKGIFSDGTAVMYMRDGKILPEYSITPIKKEYSQAVRDLIRKLHFASFGDVMIKVLYFVLSMITCLMIISGVMIWRTARDNKRYTLKQRLFHHRVTKVYLAICLSMFPAFAIIFLANKLVPMSMEGRADFVNQIFFISWLALTILGSFWNNYAKLNKNFLFLGGMLSLIIPIANGIVTNDWFWQVWQTLPRVACVDIFWLLTGITALVLALKVLKVKATSDVPTALETFENDTKKVQTMQVKRQLPT
ncbi:MAG: PepSY-associated TM helix domain-containing protein [Thermonemataceae bacterium]